MSARPLLRVFRAKDMSLPVRVFCFRGASLLPLRCWDLALDVESDAICAGYTETSGITSYLEGCVSFMKMAGGGPRG